MNLNAPDEESVQVEVRPLLGLPPMVLLAVRGILRHGTGGGGLGHGLEEDGAPGNVDLLLLQVGRQLKLERE